MIRVAAVGDIHYGIEERGPLSPHLDELAEVDLLLIAGDLTRHGDPDEAAVLAEDLARLPMPKVAVLGNHDYHQDREAEVAEAVRGAGGHVLEGDACTVAVNGSRVGVAGLKGFGGGFLGACVTPFGEPETKAFANTAADAGTRLACALERAWAERPDRVVALVHYAPIEATLVGEPEQLWPFLGNYLLAEAIDRIGADLVLHGHAHAGSPSGRTPRGVPVHNVAHPVIRKPFALFEL